MASRLDPTAAGEAFKARVTLFGKTDDRATLWTTCQWLPALASRLDPSATGKAADTFISLLRGDFLSEWEVATDGLARLADGLDAETASRAFKALVPRLHLMTPSPSMPGNWLLASLASRLDPRTKREMLTDTVNALVTRILIEKPESRNHSTLFHALSVLAPHLDEPQAANTLGTLLDQFKKPNDDVPIYVVEALARRVDVRKYVDDLTARLAKMRDWDTLLTAGERLATLVALPPPESDRKHVRKVIQRWLAASRSVPDSADPMDAARLRLAGVLARLLRGLNSPSELAEILLDPSCHGKAREVVLHRLEEVAFYQPARAAILTGFGTAVPSPFAIAVSAESIPMQIDSAEKQVWWTRRFRTVSDASEWIRKHHPEIDLDRPYSK